MRKWMERIVEKMLGNSEAKPARADGNLYGRE